MSLRRHLPVTLAIATALAGCGERMGAAGEGRPTGAVGTYVGQLSGSDAYVAVVAGSQAAVAFVADGANGIGEPFSGARDGEAIDLRSNAGSRLQIEFSGDGGRGTLVRDGEEHAVEVTPARGRAGLYRSAGAFAGRPVWAAWVVLNDGRQRGAAANGEQTVAPPPVDAADREVEVGGRPFEVAKVEPDARGGPGSDGPAAQGVFKGGAGFAGGVAQFGGFSQFGGASGGFNFGGGFNSFQTAGFGGGTGFGGFGFGGSLER